MNIATENKNLTQVISIQIVEADYADTVKKALNKLQHEAKIPGFRPGHVPFGMINKMYGKSILADELNKLISDNLFKYIEDNKIKTLGQPLPVEDVQKMDIENDKDFTAVFEVGIQPEFDIDLAQIEVVKNEITLSDKFLTSEIEKVKGEFEKYKTEMKENKEAKESMESEDGSEKAEIPELNLYEYVFGKGVVDTEAQFNEKFKEELTKSFRRSADNKFIKDAQDALIDNVKFDLPDKFMKRWLIESNNDEKHPLTAENIDAEYDDKFVKSLRLQIIENKMFEKYDVKIEENDLKQYYIEKVLSQYFPNDGSEENKKRMEELAASLLKEDQKITKQLYEAVFDNKMAELLKNHLKIKKTKINAEKFRKSLEK
ncbi:MAG: trigger factor family protein [Bacteroidales bacterium]|jgi:trigger factor|nr:trigger factor family protein [Bacteroidales bacterium]